VFNVYNIGHYRHYITFGMSELYKKESENKDISGWGFEFSFKLKSNGEKNLLNG
jgi:hypothetical protein